MTLFVTEKAREVLKNWIAEMVVKFIHEFHFHLEYYCNFICLSTLPHTSIGKIMEKVLEREAKHDLGVERLMWGRKALYEVVVAKKEALWGVYRIRNREMGSRITYIEHSKTFNCCSER